MKLNEGKILLLLSGILVGIFIAIFMVNKNLNPTTFLSYQDYEQMSMDANQLRMEIRGINKETAKLKSKLSIYQNSDNRDKDIYDMMRKELNDLKTAYGATRVSGPGIVVSINDRHKKQYLNDIDLTMSITHDEDLLFVVKDLKNAGAEAIAINGKRIIGTTSITCEGPVIMINGQYIVPPFIISAIGDPDALKYALTAEADSRFRDLQIRKLELSITKKSNVVINGVNGANNFDNPKYAKPLE